MKSITLMVVFAAMILTACNSDSSFITEDQELQVRSNHHVQSKNLLKVFRAANAITIDGMEGDWDDVPKRKLRQELDVGVPIESKWDHSGYFKILWDNENLYLFANILDQDINTEAPLIFDKDGLEFYFDGDNSKNVAPGEPTSFPPVAYDDNDDFFRFIPGFSSAISAWGIIDASNFEFEIKITSKGYNVEIKMPFADLPALSPVAGSQFGMEIQINDNDDGQRENAYKWYSSDGGSFYNPSLFGTAVLFDSIAE